MTRIEECEAFQIASNLNVPTIAYYLYTKEEADAVAEAENENFAKDGVLICAGVAQYGHDWVVVFE